MPESACNMYMRVVPPPPKVPVEDETGTGWDLGHKAL